MKSALALSATSTYQFRHPAARREVKPMFTMETTLEDIDSLQYEQTKLIEQVELLEDGLAWHEHDVRDLQDRCSKLGASIFSVKRQLARVRRWNRITTAVLTVAVVVQYL